MIKNYLKIAFRHFTKNISFSLINLFGLAFGLAAAFAVILYIQDELSYEKFNEKADRIVRAELVASYDGSELKLATAPNRAAPLLQEQLPEVEQALRVFPHNFGESASINIGDENYVEPKMYWADPNLFEVFTFNIVSGTATNALNRSNVAIISESTARKFFGDENPIGKTIKIDNRYDLEITAVFGDLPSNTHLPFSVVGSFQTVNLGKPERLSWGNASFYTFLLMNPGTEVAALEAKIGEVLKKHVPEDRQWFELKLKPLLDVHLYSKEIEDSRTSYGDISQVWVLISLAFILVFIACINYMNLATAKSQQRSKEVAVNKTLGATSGQMSVQFFMETALLVLGGIILSILVLYFFLPFFNQIADKQLSLGLLFQPAFFLGLLGIWALITAIAGSYPAIYLSSFSPMSVLRQTKEHKYGAGFVRKGLVVFQFCISTILIVGTIVLYQQLDFIRDKKLGYNPEQVVAVRIQGVSPRTQVEALEKELLQLASVKETALSQTYPGHGASGRSLYKPNAPEGQEGADLTSCRAYPGIFEVLDLDLIAGRPMKILEEGDSITQIVLNKSAVDFLGWTPEEAIGQRVNANLGVSEIVGVCEDFHYGSLHNPIGYYAFHNRRSEWLQYLLVKLDATALTTSMEQLQTTFERVAPSAAFEYTFLDEKLASLYRSEESLAKVIFIFAGLAILIACLGLFALAAYATERRTKEIGIRKVLGASVGNIVALLSKDFLQLVGIAFLIAIPIAWWSMNRWLQDFAYRIDVQWWVFALAGLMAVLIAFFTMSFQSMKAATANPVEALKRE